MLLVPEKSMIGTIQKRLPNVCIREFKLWIKAVSDGGDNSLPSGKLAFTFGNIREQTNEIVAAARDWNYFLHALNLHLTFPVVKFIENSALSSIWSKRKRNSVRPKIFLEQHKGCTSSVVDQPQCRRPRIRS